jgi:hypothetical protein
MGRALSGNTASHLSIMLAQHREKERTDDPPVLFFDPRVFSRLGE